MATLNTESIENFDSMTAEQKVEALLKMEIPDEIDMSKFVSKELFDKSTSDRAALSKQLKEKEAALKSKDYEQMTEAEKLQEQIRELQESSKEALEAVKAENAALKRKDELREFQTNFGLLGFGEKESPAMAESFADKNSAKFFDGMKKFLEQYKKSIEADLMSKTPRPDGAGSTNDKADLAVEMAKRLAGARAGNNKNFGDILSHYMKNGN